MKKTTSERVEAEASSEHPSPGLRLRHTLRGHKDEIWPIAWSPDGRTLASGSGSGDNTIRLWDGESGEQLQTLEGRKGSVYQDAIPKVKSAAVIIGTKCLGRWQIMELRTFISQCVEQEIPVIPVLLPGATRLPRNLLFLKELNWVDFKESIKEVEALDKLQWGITGERPRRLRDGTQIFTD
jgi:hypothetical protein